MSATGTPHARSTVSDETSTQSSASARLLTPADVAERWGVAKSQVWRLGRDGKVPVVMVGRYMRFRLADIEQWERSGGVGGGGL